MVANLMLFWLRFFGRQKLPDGFSEPAQSGLQCYRAATPAAAAGSEQWLAGFLERQLAEK